MPRLSLLFLFLIPLTSSYNYLIYAPFFGHSHSNFLRKIADTLTDAGHNVTLLMPVADRRLENLTVVRNTKDIIKFRLSDELFDHMKSMNEKLSPEMWRAKPDPMVMMTMPSHMIEQFRMMCRDTLTHDSLLAGLKNRHFDVAISEPLMTCGLGIFDALGIRSTIIAASFPPLDVVSHMIGQPTAPSYVPVAFMVSTTGEKMSMSDRFWNTVHSLFSSMLFRSLYAEEVIELKKKFGEEVRSVEDMMSGASFQFINSNPLLDFPFPTIQKNVAIGGIQVNTRKKEQVDEKWDSVLSERSRNVLVSFGTVARSAEMPQEFKTALLSAFESMPDTTFIWKYEEEGATLADHLPNVHLSTWVPQNALLADPRLSLFVTHGGLGSTTELAYLGKPGVIIPLFGDQSRNGIMLSRHGGALMVAKEDLADGSAIRTAIQKVLNEPSYAANASRLSQMLHNQPFSASHLVVRHCEFAAKFAPFPQLDPYGRHLSFVQYFLLDIVAILVISIITMLFIVFKCIRCWRCKSRKAKTD